MVRQLSQPASMWNSAVSQPYAFPGGGGGCKRRVWWLLSPNCIFLGSRPFREPGMLGLNCTPWQIRPQPWKSSTEKGRYKSDGGHSLAELKVHPGRQIAHSRNPSRFTPPQASHPPLNLTLFSQPWSLTACLPRTGNRAHTLHIAEIDTHTHLSS